MPLQPKRSTMPLAVLRPGSREASVKEETEDSVFGQVGELSADLVHGIERSSRERDMKKGNRPGQKRLRRIFSKGCGGEIENKHRPEQGRHPPENYLGV